MDSKILPVILTGFLLVATCSGCYVNYQTCYSTYTSAVLADSSIHCSAATAAVSCLVDDANDCTGSENIPSQYTDYLNATESVEAGCVLMLCSQKQLDCSNLTLNAYNEIVDGTPSPQFCNDMTAAITCYQNLTNECPSVGSAINTSVSAYSSLKYLYCGVSGIPSGTCQTIMFECVNETVKMADVFSGINMTDLNVIANLPATICPYFTKVFSCYDRLNAECPGLAGQSISQLKPYQDMAAQFCTADACYTKITQCYAPFMSACVTGQQTSSTMDKVKCCGLADTMSKCITDSGCTTMPLGIGFSPSAIMVSMESVCSGYQDYCTGLDVCVNAAQASGNLADINNLCVKIGALITCVEAACSGKPSLEGPALAQISSLFGKICQGISDSPNILQCASFGSCAATAPSTPGSMNSVPSIVAVRDSTSWCKLAKSYMSCAANEVTDNACSIGGTFSTDVTSVKRSSDEICAGVRDPCVGALSCLPTLQGSQTEMSLLGTCPNINNFVACAESALTTCGASSKVQATYSITDIGSIFTQTCTELIALSQCQQAQMCQQVQLPVSVGDQLDQYTDQTFWCGKLNKILKCSTIASKECKQTTAQTAKFEELFQKVNNYCPDKVPGTTPAPTCDGTECSGSHPVVASVLMTMLIAMVMLV